jgi:hypothetical protein
LSINFCTCLFKERPGDCQFSDGPRGCTADDWDIALCLLQHYGNKFTVDGGLRFLDSCTHLALENDTFDENGNYEIAEERRYRLMGSKLTPESR